MIMKDIIEHLKEGYTKYEILDIINEYDDYIIEFPENHDDGSYPVCLSEFVENDYRTPTERLAKDLLSQIKAQLEADIPEEEIEEDIFNLICLFNEEFCSIF